MTTILQDKRKNPSNKQKIKVEKGSIPGNPHDSLFKQFVDKEEYAINFLNELLPNNVKKIIDFSTIKIENTEFISSKLNKRIADCLYLIKSKDKATNFLIHIEHQSGFDKNIDKRVSDYSNAITQKYSKKLKDIIVINIVVYNQKPSQKIPSFFDDSNHPKIKEQYYNKPINIFLDEISQEKLQSLGISGASLYLLAQKKDSKFINKVEKFFDYFHQAINDDFKHGNLYNESLFNYISYYIDENDHDKVNQILSERFENNQLEVLMRSIAEANYEKGKNAGIYEGIEKGVEKTAVNMLKTKKYDTNEICSVTGLTEDDLLKLKKIVSNSNSK